MKKIKLYNSFHQTEVTLQIGTLPHTLTDAQVARARRVLCPSRSSGCICGGEIGERGRQDVELDIAIDRYGYPVVQVLSEEVTA